MNKKVGKVIIKSFFVMVFTVLFYSFGFYKMCIAPKRISDNYFKTFNLRFKGTVIYSKAISHGAGYVCLDLIDSNVERYNPSDSISDYLCLSPWLVSHQTSCVSNISDWFLTN